MGSLGPPRDRLPGPRAVDVRAPQDERLLSDDHLELSRVRFGSTAGHPHFDRVTRNLPFAWPT